MLVVFVIFAAMVSTIISWRHIVQSESDTAHSSTHNNPLVTTLMTGITMFQSMAFLKGFDYQWPDNMQGMFDAFESTGGFHVSGIQYTLPPLVVNIRNVKAAGA